MSAARIVRIGCGAGFWGDTPEGPAQLVRSGGVDYLVLDYLAEVTMSILARMKAKNPELGYATDFVTLVMKPLAKEIAQKRIKVIANAGGVNPAACRAALEAVFAQAGVDLKIGVVEGDDLTLRADEFRLKGARELSSGDPLPERLVSVNAYLGALPIAAALDLGADIVLTGRCVEFRAGAWATHSRIQMERRRLRSSVRGQPGWPYHRMRRAGDRRHLH